MKNFAVQFKPLLTFASHKLQIYLVGSFRVDSPRAFDSILSDLDLLYIPNIPLYNSLDDYLKHFEQAANLVKSLQRSESRLVDIFVLNHEILELYFSFLPLYWDGFHPRNAQPIFGKKENEYKKVAYLPTNKCRSLAYREAALRFCEEYKRTLPVADTRIARKITKRLNIGIKLIICAMADVADLMATEQLLAKTTSFNELNSILAKVNCQSIEFKPILQAVLNGDNVNDWPEWMATQEEFALWLDKIQNSQIVKIDDTKVGRLIAGLTRINDMLMLDLKNIITTDNKDIRGQLIEAYADKTASLISTLAITGGVKSLFDFERPNTPELVKQAYEVFIQHLQISNPTAKCLASALVLLEYSFQQGIKTANTQLN